MGILELIVVVLVILWLLGYFGRGRVYGRGVAPSGQWSEGGVVHLLLVLAVILIVLRLLRVL